MQGESGLRSCRRGHELRHEDDVSKANHRQPGPGSLAGLFDHVGGAKRDALFYDQFSVFAGQHGGVVACSPQESRAHG